MRIPRNSSKSADTPTTQPSAPTSKKAICSGTMRATACCSRPRTRCVPVWFEGRCAERARSLPRATEHLLRRRLRRPDHGAGVGPAAATGADVTLPLGEKRRFPPVLPFVREITAAICLTQPAIASEQMAMVAAGFGQVPPILDALPDHHRLPNAAATCEAEFLN